MSKKFMHIMIDGSDIPSNEVDRIYESLSKLNDSYDIAITTNNVQISTYNQDIINDINEKIDIILSDMERFNKFTTTINRQITHVFGLQNNK